MELQALHNLLPVILRAKGEADIRVSGVSMEPLLHAGDTVTVAPFPTYEVGDILIFRYKNGELLIHRLLKIEGNRYFCKGDNAFRLEDMGAEQILGKATHRNGTPLKPWAPWQMRFSYAVNRAFFRCRYDAEKTKQTSLYRAYKIIILKKEVHNMTFCKNTAMDYIITDETTVAVFDPDTGDTHFLDETATDIINALDDPCDLETLLVRLCEIYDATPDMIRSDVEEFLADMVEKKVIAVA